ncbi:MAG TPA: PDZ domain-containing protein, partial [Terracidiphilus sp.]|nr:PDZ domain-containing protein [Terracidiphilus sp.]
METSLFNRLQATLLAVATAGLVFLAVLNFRQERSFQQPTDGVWWSETAGNTGLLAQRVLPGSPGTLAGIREGDLLMDVNGQPVVHLSDLERELYSTGVYGKADYSITREGVKLDTPVAVYLEPTSRGVEQALRLIGLIYLAIGIYVLFRRWTALRSTHFFVFCLVSFAFYALNYTGRFDPLDWTVFWLNLAAESLQPALFLHFALSFPEERLKDARRRYLIPIVYTPGALLLGLWVVAFNRWEATGLLKHRLEQAGTAYVAVFYVLAAALFMLSYRRADSPLLRQQLKWLTRGALLSVVPFTVFYAIPFLLDVQMPDLLTKIAGISLVFIPLTFAWAIVRYRLMDTDLIFKRGVAYTLATGMLLGAYFGVIAIVAEMVHAGTPQALRETALIIAVLVTAAIFDPLKRRVQNWVDRVFDRHRYDYRKALVEFGRGLSSETNLKALLSSIVERLPRTLLVARVAVFLADQPGALRLAASHGLTLEALAAQDRLALGFLDFDRDATHSHIFFENTQQILHLPEDEQQAAARLDLNYYLPCRVAESSLPNKPAASRTIAVIGLGRTLGGDFLSSEDVELLESLASYIGI